MLYFKFIPMGLCTLRVTEIFGKWTKQNVKLCPSQISLILLEFTECQDLIAQCLRIEATQRILLEDVLRHPWMRLEAEHLSSCPNGNSASVASNSEGGSNSNQHKPSLNSVGSCVSSSTDECTTESPSHNNLITQTSRTLSASKLRLRPPNSAPQTSKHQFGNPWIEGQI